MLNVPYQCADGITYTVTICKPYRADQWCETVEKQNGNLVTTMDSAWSQMTGRLKGCSVTPAPRDPGSPASLSASRQIRSRPSIRHHLFKEFPTVDQIMTQVKEHRARQDTANRQLSALA